MSVPVISPLAIALPSLSEVRGPSTSSPSPSTKGTSPMFYMFQILVSTFCLSAYEARCFCGVYMFYMFQILVSPFCLSALLRSKVLLWSLLLTKLPYETLLLALLLLAANKMVDSTSSWLWSLSLQTTLCGMPDLAT